MALAAAGLLAQATPQAPRFRAAVNLVTVDVIVTDSQGLPAEGMKAEDFELFEDGVRQRILDFREVRPLDLDGAAPASSRPLVEPGLLSPAAQTAPADRRLLVLLFDRFTSQWENFQRVGQALQSFIAEELQPQDRVAILAVGDSALLTPGFTSDRQVLLAALQQLLRRPGGGSLAQGMIDGLSEIARMSREMAELTDSTDAIEQAAIDLANSAILQATHNDFSARSVLTTLKYLSEALGPIHGRKAVVLVSEGFAATRAVQINLPRVVDAANRSNVAIYTFNPRGLQVTPVERDPVRLREDPRRRTLESTGRVRAGNSDFDLMSLEIRTNTDDDGLQGLSLQTGGLAFRNSNDFRQGLETVQRDLHRHYQLAYVPSGSDLDGRFRRIEVRVRVKGYSVRARKGYFARAPELQFWGSADEQMYQGLHHPERLNQLALHFRPSSFLDLQGESVTHLTLHLDPRGVSLKEEGGKRSGRVKLLGAAFTREGEVAQEFLQDFQLQMDAASYPTFLSQGATLRAQMRLPAGSYQVKAVVRDDPSGAMGSSWEEFSVPECAPSVPCLSSLVLSNPPTAAPSAGDGSNPFRYGDHLFLPAGQREPAAASTLTFFFHVYGVRGSGSGADAVPHQYRYLLSRGAELQESSPRLPVETHVQNSQGGFMVVLRLPASELEAGEHRLEVQLLGAGSDDILQRRQVRFLIP